MRKGRGASGSGTLWNVKSAETHRNINEGSFILGQKQLDGYCNSQDKLLTFPFVKFYCHDLNIMDLCEPLSASLFAVNHTENFLQSYKEEKGAKGAAISRTHSLLLPKRFSITDKNSVPQTTCVPASVPHYILPPRFSGLPTSDSDLSSSSVTCWKPGYRLSAFRKLHMIL